MFCVNEVADESADRMVDTVEAELEKPHNMARALKLSNPEKILIFDT